MGVKAVQEFTFDVIGFPHLEALRDGLDEVTMLVSAAESTADLFEELVDNYGWTRVARECPPFLEPNVFSVRKQWFASSIKYWVIELIDEAGFCRVKCRYAGGVDEPRP